MLCLWGIVCVCFWGKEEEFRISVVLIYSPPRCIIHQYRFLLLCVISILTRSPLKWKGKVPGRPLQDTRSNHRHLSGGLRPHRRFMGLGYPSGSSAEGFKELGGSQARHVFWILCLRPQPWEVGQAQLTWSFTGQSREGMDLVQWNRNRLPVAYLSFKLWSQMMIQIKSGQIILIFLRSHYVDSQNQTWTGRSPQANVTDAWTPCWFPLFIHLVDPCQGSGRGNLCTCLAVPGTQTGCCQTWEIWQWLSPWVRETKPV